MNYLERGALIIGTGLATTYVPAMVAVAVDQHRECPKVEVVQGRPVDTFPCGESFWAASNEQILRSEPVPIVVAGLGMLCVWHITKPLENSSSQNRG